MKILVTGGAGFIGSHLTSRLLERGDDVAVIDDFNDFYSPRLKRENVAPFLDNPAFSLHEVDIRSAVELTEVIEGFSPDVVCHLAARAGIRPSIEDPLLYEDTNSMGTLNIINAVKEMELKNFVFASSSSVYGTNTKLPFSEDDPVRNAISPYAATKRSSELMLGVYSRLYSIPVICLRFFTVYGERGRPDMAIARFTKAISEGKEIQLYGDGSARRDFTYIDDILMGLVAAIDRPAKYEIINLGESRVVDVNFLITTIEDKLGKKANVVHCPAFAGDVPVTYADISKAARLLDYAPKVSIEDGISRYVDWFVDEGFKFYS
jgi:UDP-glucuronate 4-epimerase